MGIRDTFMAARGDLEKAKNPTATQKERDSLKERMLSHGGSAMIDLRKSIDSMQAAAQAGNYTQKSKMLELLQNILSANPDVVKEISAVHSRFKNTVNAIMSGNIGEAAGAKYDGLDNKSDFKNQLENMYGNKGKDPYMGTHQSAPDGAGDMSFSPKLPKGSSNRSHKLIKTAEGKQFLKYLYLITKNASENGFALSEQDEERLKYLLPKILVKLD